MKGGFLFNKWTRGDRRECELTLYETYVAVNLRERELAWFHRDGRGRG
jgi:hypothetical protein